MPVQWIREPSHSVDSESFQCYEYADAPGSGFMFKVDAQKKIIEEMSQLAAQNYDHCLAGVRDGSIIDKGIQDFEHDYWDAGAVKCHCGATVELSNDWRGSRCTCGAEYDNSGQQLRANWRDICRETGEISDIDFLN